jgi:hypothetical protein
MDVNAGFDSAANPVYRRGRNREGKDMTYLYCAVHGRGHENRTIDQQERYREAGECVLIVKGRLISGPHRCDKCNTSLKRGDDATLLSAFPRHIVEGMVVYDFAQERRYFDMRKAEARWYGTAWPGVASASAARPAGQ